MYDLSKKIITGVIKEIFLSRFIFAKWYQYIINKGCHWVLEYLLGWLSDIFNFKPIMVTFHFHLLKKFYWQVLNYIDINFVLPSSDKLLVKVWQKILKNTWMKRFKLIKNHYKSQSSKISYLAARAMVLCPKYDVT